jgi:hypothetical protein
MQRFIDHAVRLGVLSRGRFFALAIVPALLASAALPGFASAATQTLTVEKAGTGSGTVTSSPAGIECGGVCSAPFTEGATVVLTGAPGTNTAAVVWTGCAHVNLENECSVTMSTAKSVTATFSLIERPLSVVKKGTGTGTVTSSPAGIECGGKCSASFVKGTVMTLSAAPGPGSEPVVWGGCESVTAEGKCVVTMSTAKSVTATFDLPVFQLTVEKAGTGTGTVTSSPAGIECGGVCSAPFTEKSTVTLTGSPGVNSAAVVWAGCTSTNGENKCLVTMDAAKEVTATFKLAPRQLTVKKVGSGSVTSSPAGITCGGTCSASFEHGTVVTLTGVPGANAESVEWTGCGSIDAEGRCLVTMSAAKSVTATFVVGLTISKVGTGSGTVTSSPAGIACGEACSAHYSGGTTITLEGKSDLHSRPVKWGGCTKVLTGDKCEVLLSAATNVIANFELESQYLEHTVTVQLKGTGKGSVTSAPAGIECGEDCTEKFLHKTSLTLVPSPAPGSVFDHWVGGGCAAFTGSCQTIVNSSSLVRAYFVAVGPRTLTVAKAGTGNGTITSKPVGIECGSICSTQFEAPTKVVLKAVADKSSRFKGWSGEGCSGTSTCRVTMTEARNVTATFEKIPAPPPSPSEVFVSSAARVRGGKAMLRISCNGPSPCQGTLKLLLKIRNAEGQTKGLVVGTAPFSLPAGTVQTIAIKLTPRAMRMLASTGRLKLRIVGASESHVLRLGQRPS